MTDLAYLNDLESGYVREFRARVVALPPGGLVLDRTYFYPAGGGQPCDRGSVRALGAEGNPEIPVIDVVKTGPSVLHRVRGSPGALSTLRVGVEVEGRIDWDRRHRHMRLHTGQHYLSARIFARTGLRTRRATLRGEEASLDLDGPLPPECSDDLRSDMYDLVRSPREVRIRYVRRAEWEREPAARSGLVPLPAQVDPIRVIEIDGIDRCPCGGTHVRSTEEVGTVELLFPGAGAPTADHIAFRFAQGSPALPTPPA